MVGLLQLGFSVNWEAHTLRWQGVIGKAAKADTAAACLATKKARDMDHGPFLCFLGALVQRQPMRD